MKVLNPKWVPHANVFNLQGERLGTAMRLVGEGNEGVEYLDKGVYKVAPLYTVELRKPYAIHKQYINCRCK